MKHCRINGISCKEIKWERESLIKQIKQFQKMEGWCYDSL